MARPSNPSPPSPRVRMAARLYGSGAVATKAEASRLAGLHPSYLALLTSERHGKPEVRALVERIDALIENEAVDESVIIRKLGRAALGRLAHLMETGPDRIALDAAKDLADRSPNTAKTQKVQVESFSVSNQDVKELASAILEASKRSASYQKVVTEGLVEVHDLPVPERTNG